MEENKVTEKKTATETGESARYNAKKIPELERHIEKLEVVVNHLSQRLAQVASSYETELAFAIAELHIEKRYGSEETD